jgi:integrase
MQSSELSLDTAVWTIPGSRTKNGQQHTIPLSPLAVALIREALADAGEGAKYVFPNPDGQGPLPASAVARTIVRAHESSERRPNGRFGIARWSAHDCRRTAITNMSRLGVAPLVQAHVVNHISVTKATVLAKHYDHYDYAKEKRAALELWAERLAAIVADMVIP